MKKQLNLTVLVSSLAVGGAEQLLLMLLDNINRHRFAVRIVFLRSPGMVGNELMSCGDEIITNVLRSRFDPVGFFRLVHLFRSAPTDVLLLINHLNTLVYGVPAARIAGVPACVNWENETFKRYPFHPFTMFCRRLFHAGVDVVVAAANGHKHYIAEVEKIPLQKIEVIYNGVEPARFRSTLPPHEARERLGIPGTSPVVSILAVLRPDKAHEVFLDAAALIRQTLPDTHFLILGDGPQRLFLEQYAAARGLSGSVHFLGFQRELADILAAVDVNMLTSKPEQETLSVAAIEAMAAGIPIVCTDVGCMDEIVIQGVTGFRVPVGDVRALAGRALEILRNPEIKERMGAACKHLVEEKLSARQMTESFEDLFLRTYTRVVTRKRIPRHD
ncbi:MAG: glycosyltransferase [Desulfobacterota bacterium]|nr:glycosyltransferase [Thermodesulfobacteriota bacterium]